MRARRKLFGEYAFLGNYKQHPDKNQENFFFGLLKECLEQGKITKISCARKWRRTMFATTPWKW